MTDTYVKSKSPSARQEPEAFTVREAATRVSEQRREKRKDFDELAEAAHDIARNEADPIDKTKPIEGHREIRKESSNLHEIRSRRDELLADWLPEGGNAEETASEAQTETAHQDTHDQAAAAQRAQYEQSQRVALEQTLQAKQQYEHAVIATAANAAQLILAEFPDVSTDADLAALAQYEPARYARLQQMIQHYRGSVGEVQQAQAQHASQVQEAFKVHVAHEDEKFLTAHPEMKNRDVAYRAQRDVADYLSKDRGLSRERLAELCQQPWFRTSETQEILYDAMQWKRAQQRAKEARSVPVPPVQRPGVSQPGSRAGYGVASAAEKFAKSHSLRDAAKLVGAQRRAAQRARG